MSISQIKKQNMIRVYLGPTSVVDEQLKNKLRDYFDRIITAIEELTPGEQKSLIFQREDVQDETDNIVIDCLITKEDIVGVSHVG
jgi:hypothetical protein